MRYKAVLFDLDGTLLDTLGDLHAALNFALAQNGFPGHSLAEVRSYVGDGVKKLIERALPEGASAFAAEQCLADFKEEYNRHIDVLTKPYEGIVDALRTLRENGVRVAVVTNKYDSAAQLLVREYFGELAELVIGNIKNVPVKPAPNTANMALAAFGVHACEAAYVGDSGVDCMTAANAGLDFYGLTWGFWDRERLASAGKGVLCDSAEELLGHLLRD